MIASKKRMEPFKIGTIMKEHANEFVWSKIFNFLKKQKNIYIPGNNSWGGINRQNLYRIFTGERNPRFKTMESIVRGVGFKLTFIPEIHSTRKMILI